MFLEISALPNQNYVKYLCYIDSSYNTLAVHLMILLGNAASILVISF